MAFHQTDAHSIVRPDYIRSGAAQPQAPASLEPVRIAGILIVLGAILATGVWVFRSKPALPSVLMSALPASLRASPTPPVSGTTAAVPPKALPQPQAPRRRALSASPTAIAPSSDAPRAPQTSATASLGVVATAPDADVAAARDAAPSVRAGVYSRSDGDVTPPQLVSPSFIGSLPSGMRPDDVVTFEYVVNERGTVELAKVSSAPRTLGESMLFTMNLQSIKSWQFRPALKDGSPVRYRQSMSFGPKSTKTPPRG
jgi:hypothetical protein